MTVEANNSARFALSLSLFAKEMRGKAAPGCGAAK